MGDPDVLLGNSELEILMPGYDVHSHVVPIYWKRSGPFDHLGKRRGPVEHLINSLSFTHSGKKKRTVAPDGPFQRALCLRFLGSFIPFDEAEFRADVKKGYHYVLPICAMASPTSSLTSFDVTSVSNSIEPIGALFTNEACQNRTYSLGLTTLTTSQRFCKQRLMLFVLVRLVSA